MSSFLQLNDLCIGYGQKPVLQNISFTLHKGQIAALLGANGCGKSTLLRTIAGLHPPLSGSVSIDGHPISTMSPAQRAAACSILLTHLPAPAYMRCREVVALGRLPRTNFMGMLSRDDKAAVEEAMSLTDTLSLAESFFSCISDGQRQRVLLARAICQNAPLLLLDEPTAYLDVHYKRILPEILQTLRAQGRTILFSLHEPDIAQRLCDEIIALKDGRILQAGTADEIFYGSLPQQLYGLPLNAWNHVYGTYELEPMDDAPEYLILGGGQTAVQVYRSLWRQGRSFIAACVDQNDIAYPAAAALAQQILHDIDFTQLPRSITQCIAADNRYLHSGGRLPCISAMAILSGQNRQTYRQCR